MATATAKKPVKKTAAPKAPAKPAPTKVVAKPAAPAKKSEPAPNETFHGVLVVPGMSPEKAKKRVGVPALVPLANLSPSTFNPRSQVGDVKDLAAAIRAEGLLSALVVRPTKKSGQFEVIAGHRRLKALQSIAYKDDVPVLIRSDLVGDDERALAVSISENSEDGRVNLNMIEIGRAAQKLEKKKWTVARIAAEAGLNVQRVRRALDLMATPDEVQKKVAEGNWSAAAGLEYAKLDEKTREAIRSRLTEAVSAADIKRARKEAQKDATAAAALKGAPAAATTRDGKSVGKRPTLAAWRGSREKSERLHELCHLIQTASADDVGSVEYHEIRGAAACIMWDRGDRSTPLPPDMEPEKGDAGYESAMKDLTAFNAMVKAEAARHTPDKA